MDNKQLSPTLRSLQLEYILFWIAILFIAFCYEMEWLVIGAYIDEVQISFVLTTACIIVSLAVIPLSLKMHSKKIKSVSKYLPLDQLLTHYKQTSQLRLIAFAFIAILNLFTYYATLNQIGLFCLLITMTASLFCIPSLDKLKTDLQLDKPEDIEPLN